MVSRILGTGTLILGVLVATYLVGNSVWIWVSGSSLDTKLAALRAAGDPVMLSDLAQPAPDQEKNAATFLNRARKDVDAMTKELNALAARPGYDPDQLDEDDRKKLASVVHAYPQVFPLLEQAGACATYDPQLDFTASPAAVQTAVMANAADFRGVITVLQGSAQVQLAEGHHREALKTGLLLLRLSWLYETKDFLISQLVVCAARAIAVSLCNQALRAAALPDEDRAALESEAARHDSLDGFARTLKNERAFGLSSYAPLKNWLNRALLDADESDYLDLAQEQIDLTAKPYEEFVKAVNAFKANRPKHYALAGLWLPAAHKTREATERTRAVVRCLRVLNALQRTDAKPANGVPDLATLKLPDGATTDPFTGQPLHVKVVDGQWVIYTVGPDLKDDGGDLANYHDFGVGPLPGK